MACPSSTIRGGQVVDIAQAAVAHKQHSNCWQFLLILVSLRKSEALGQQAHDDCCGKSASSTPAAEPRTMSSVTNLREITMRISRRANCRPEPAFDVARRTPLFTGA